MTNIEHYFENLLFYGQDIKRDPNKRALCAAERNAVEQCAEYVLYSLCDGPDNFNKIFNPKGE